MSIYIGADSFSSSFTTSILLSYPAGVQSGDLLIAAIAVNSDAPTITPPAGWTAVDGAPIIDETFQGGVYYKLHTTGSSASWAVSAGYKALGAISAFRNVSQTNPVIVGAGGKKSVTSSSLVASEITTMFPDQYIVTVHGIRTSSLTALSSNPPGMTLADGGIVPGGGAIGLHMFYEQIPSVHATGSRSATYDAGSATGYGIMLGINEWDSFGAVSWIGV